MNGEDIAKRADELMKLDSSIDRDMALFLARSQAKDKETRQLIANIGKHITVQADKVWKHLKSPAEIALVGSTAAVGLAASPGVLPLVAAYMGFGAYLWQRENQNNALRKLAQQIQKRDFNSNPSPLNFDQFMELFMQFMEIASKSELEEKQDYLVNLCVNSVVSSTIPFNGKQTLFRIHSQISLEEIHTLHVLYHKELALVEDGINSKLEQGVEVRKAVDANTSESTDISAKIAWSKLTAEQFFSGYNEADAIYDTL